MWSGEREREGRLNNKVWGGEGKDWLKSNNVGVGEREDREKRNKVGVEREDRGKEQ